MEPMHLYKPGIEVPYTWSARFSIEPPLEASDALQRLNLVPNAFKDPEWPVSGALLGTDGSAKRSSLVLGLDPSRSFGTPTRHKSELIACMVSELCDWPREPEAELPEVRIIMGRRRGYQAGALEYSVADVRTLADAHDIKPAIAGCDLFSFRYLPAAGIREHVEPGVVIGCKTSELPRMLDIAFVMGQERIVPQITGVKTQVFQRS